MHAHQLFPENTGPMCWVLDSKGTELAAYAKQAIEEMTRIKNLEKKRNQEPFQIDEGNMANLTALFEVNPLERSFFHILVLYPVLDP